MITCWRCGVDFDGSPYREGAPCLDCQEILDESWSNSEKLRPGRITAEERKSREDLVRTHYNLGKLDKEIAEAIGMYYKTVGLYRRRLKLPAHHKPEKHMWKDEKAHIEHSSQLIERRKEREREEGRSYVRKRKHNPNFQ